jgi:ubiquinone/menaquinone biosynthesis C-methylase UbiE
MGIESIKRSWEAFGRHDPMWAILSDPAKRGNRWDTEEFFATGRDEIARLLLTLEGLGLQPRRGWALDFGSGAGRLSFALAGVFEQVRGVDISASMIELACAHNRIGDRVAFVLGDANRIPFEDATFDFVYSRIVLQHIGAAEQCGYIKEFVRVVRPGGLIVFQTPSRCLTEPGSHFASPIETPEGTFTIDMNTLPRGTVEGTLNQAGARLLEAIEDRSAGEKFESFLYVATR